MDKLIKLFTFEENPNLKRVDLHLEKALYVKGMPLKQAGIMNERNEIIACGDKKFLMVYDIGKDVMTRVSSSFMTGNLVKNIKQFRINKDET